MTPQTVNGTANGIAPRVATPLNVTPTKAPKATPNGTAIPRAVSSASIFGNGASISSSNSFHHDLEEIGAQYYAPSPRAVAAPTIVKKEFATGANTFFGAANATTFEDEDGFQDGEV
ncbi:hypothetical protein NPX13_g10942 [Xylaria arbuscula]|uniref:Uncharacterized protein n=1 Tax=Xylaria arbuscula TaxID=114810 RepID=A0A9W8TG43_9PEZI|nr:hypothetical protein NPX13_g10942 [Xylaria arbuscula]